MLMALKENPQASWVFLVTGTHSVPPTCSEERRQLEP